MKRAELIVAINEAITTQTPVHIYRKIDKKKTLWYKLFRIDSVNNDFSSIEGVEYEQRSLENPMISSINTAAISEIELLS